MTAVELLTRAVDVLHRTILQDIQPLTPEHLAWRPAPQANPIGFLFWHFVRTEDNLVRRLQGESSIWQAEGWDRKFGLPAQDQGTGFATDQVTQLSLPPLAEFMPYAEKVMNNTSDFLKGLDDGRLGQPLDPERPTRNIATMVQSFIVEHGWWHLGEIKYIKGMLGMPAPR
ncbi:MAG: hypothetical protein A2Y60_02870 [Chloroflexi bacterium RBG_13_54_9]|nr:MAG: hypothetical protein A2Y60_02870 [Chloroflexi bacterium RBG_13_54_9]